MGGAQSNKLDDGKSVLSEDNQDYQFQRRSTRKMNSANTLRENSIRQVEPQKSNSDLSELSLHSLESNNNQTVQKGQNNAMEKIYMKSLQVQGISSSESSSESEQHSRVLEGKITFKQGPTIGIKSSYYNYSDQEEESEHMIEQNENEGVFQFYEKLKQIKGLSMEDSLESMKDFRILNELDRNMKVSRKRYYIKSQLSLDMKQCENKHEIFRQTKPIEIKAEKNKNNDHQESDSEESYFDFNHHSDRSNDAITKLKNFKSNIDFLAHQGVSYICRKGSHDKLPNQDDFFIYIDNYQKVLAVIDGHGYFGHFISSVVSKLLFRGVMTMPEFWTKPQRAIKNLFEQIQLNIKKQLALIIKKNANKSSFLKQNADLNDVMSGCVCTLVIQRENKLYIGHIGNTKAVIFQNLHTAQKVKENIIQITPEHIPSQNEIQEQVRIYAQGGEIKTLSTDKEPKIYVRGRIYPGLHVTRSFGDEIGHLVGITSVPYYREYTIKLGIDTFLLLGTASAFELLSQEDIINHLHGFSVKDIYAAADGLYAIIKSAQFLTYGYYEDTTFILLALPSNQKNLTQIQ